MIRKIVTVKQMCICEESTAADMRDLLPNQSRDIIREVLILTAHLVWVAFDFRRGGSEDRECWKEDKGEKRGKENYYEIG